MQRCSERAFAMCPYRKGCGTIHEATFTDDSECADFNRRVDEMPMTNADRIRAMSDEELAELFADDERACPPRHPNCRKYIDKCDGCWLEWLKQPVED